MADELLLLPMPRQVTLGGGVLELPAALTLSGVQGVLLRRTAARELGARLVRGEGRAVVRMLPAEAAPADLVLGHLADFAPIEGYLQEGRRSFGLDRSSLLSVQATQRRMRELAAYLRYLAGARRLLPAFVQLHDVFLDRARTVFWVGCEHEWAEGPRRFQRYSVEAGPWQGWFAARAEKER
jgi:hypothetical protein